MYTAESLLFTGFICAFNHNFTDISYLQENVSIMICSNFARELKETDVFFHEPFTMQFEMCPCDFDILP